MSRDVRTLEQIGERRILEEFFAPRYGHIEYFGSDSAALPMDNVGGYLVASTDPCPPPMAAVLGFTDPFYAGWLLSTINFSDIAASGARPLALLTSLVLPPEFLAWQLENLLDGIDESAGAVGANVVGGNIKDGAEVALTATALGINDNRLIGRNGGKPGDSIAIVGEIGAFWAGVFMHRRDALDGIAEDHYLLRNILRPVPQCEVMCALSERDLVRAAMDISDGLAPTLRELSASSGHGIELNLGEIEWSSQLLEASSLLQIEPFRLALGWGDWAVVVAVKEEDLTEVENIAQDAGSQLTVIGSMTDRSSGVWITNEDGSGSLGRFESERFASDSWMRTGIEDYENLLQFGSLFS